MTHHNTLCQQKITVCILVHGSSADDLTYETQPCILNGQISLKSHINHEMTLVSPMGGSGCYMGSSPTMGPQCGAWGQGDFWSMPLS